MERAQILLMGEGFPRARPVAGLKSLANFWKSHRCGIYVLHFSNGDFYVGQSVDVTKRFTQHRKNWGDIEHIFFKRVAKRDLNAAEESLIKKLESQNLNLRNISLTVPGKIPYGLSDFDLIMPPSQQEKWLSDATISLPGKGKVQNESQRLKYARKFTRLLEMPQSNEAIQVAGAYVQSAIPYYKPGEMYFWSCTCLPQTGLDDFRVYSRININWQNVFEVICYRGKLEFSFFTTKAILEDNSRLRKFAKRFKYSVKGAWKTDRQLKPGGQDQINFYVYDPQAMLELLDDREMLRAMRVFNLRLSRQGPCNSSKFHCFDLADRLTQ